MHILDVACICFVDRRRGDARGWAWTSGLPAEAVPGLWSVGVGGPGRPEPPAGMGTPGMIFNIRVRSFFILEMDMKIIVTKCDDKGNVFPLDVGGARRKNKKTNSYHL